MWILEKTEYETIPPKNIFELPPKSVMVFESKPPVTDSLTAIDKFFSIKNSTIFILLLTANILYYFKVLASLI